MCSRVGTIKGENKHGFGRAIERSTKEPVRSERSRRNQGKKQRVRNVEKELEPVVAR
jgi:hypothetical protein